MATQVKKKETVNIKTFKKWEFKDQFEILRKDDNGNITKWRCKFCADHLSDVLNEARRRNMKGVVVNSIMHLADGVECVHKGNLFRHTRSGGLHDWAKRKYGTSDGISSPSPSTS
ncbi:hypothetical protein SNE40_009596 [Patella caerulea]|uniref:Uncharacterized protein n=1 Tax=Patella caerulea TaxID=87958 RepID=A0AAN8PS00_PATCE